jgi:hypothetical protein
MCDWIYEEVEGKETINTKAKAKSIREIEKKVEERPLTALS